MLVSRVRPRTSPHGRLALPAFSEQGGRDADTDIAVCTASAPTHSPRGCRDVGPRSVSHMHPRRAGQSPRYRGCIAAVVQGSRHRCQTVRHRLQRSWLQAKVTVIGIERQRVRTNDPVCEQDPEGFGAHAAGFASGARRTRYVRLKLSGKVGSSRRRSRVALEPRESNVDSMRASTGNDLTGSVSNPLNFGPSGAQPHLNSQSPRYRVMPS